MLTGKYIWQDGKPVHTTSLKEWAVFMETRERRVAWTQVGKTRISTVFLSLDHSFGGKVPVLFETMVFCEHRKSLNGLMQRYTTLVQARRGHELMVERVLEMFPSKKAVTENFNTGEMLPNGAAKEQDIGNNWRTLPGLE